MSNQVGPTVARERLRIRLRQLRESRELTADTVAREMFWSLSKLNRVETGAVTISPAEVRTLLDYYGVQDKTEVSRLVNLAATSRNRGWWSSHQLTREYQRFVGYEAESSRISVYQGLFVPGLLQTEDYARAITAKIIRKSPENDDVTARIEVRMNRQRDLFARMSGPNPPDLIAALDEAILRRPIGGGAVMRRQLDHLLDMTRHSSIQLIVVPLALEGHPGLGGTFELLEFAGSGDSDVVFVESAAQDFVVEDQKVTRSYRENMKILQETGVTGDGAAATISAIRDELS
jgi:transcriptional regulator with XRE-family HTH domain